jgi:hypothetical protein
VIRSKPDQRLVATYDRLRASVPELTDELSGVAALLRGGGTGRLIAER